MLFLFHKIIVMDAILKIDLDAIIDNIQEYRKMLGVSKKFCAVVKADCYGLGSKNICHAIDNVVDYFAVSTRKEFYEIKKYVNKPILLLTPIYENITILAKKSCEFCVSNFEELKRIERVSKRNKDVVYNIHIAINTGMNRFGFNDLAEINELLNIIQKTQNIKICGVFSHLFAGNSRILTENQIKRLEQFKKLLSLKINSKKIIFHLSNTSGFDFCNKFDMVRIGLGMFLKYNNDVFSLTSKIIEIQKVKPGETVGYGLGFISEKFTKVAVVSIGYADGIFKRIAGRGFVLVNGNFAKILAVCMDCLIIDVSEINVNYLDEVILIGKSGDKQIFVCDVAIWCDTIDHEVIARLSRRIKRVYIGGNINANNHGKI